MSKLGLKLVAVIFITLGLLIPLALIRALIEERTRYRAEASTEISRSWTAAQDVSGPLLAVPSQPYVDKDRRLFVAPETLFIQSSLRTETRKRGLYAVPVYTTKLTISGEFDLSEVVEVSEATWTDLDLGEAFVTLSLSDNRGIVQQPTLSWAGEAREVASGSRLLGVAEGLHAVVGPLELENQSRYPFRIEVELRGMESLQFAPIASDTRVVMDAGWSHPSFVGRFLPVEYEIVGDRFTAEWRVSGLAGGSRQAWLAGASGGDSLPGNTFGVSLINPVDIYQQAMRSVKYGNLIVLLTFTAFFLVEMVRRLLLHPMQYLLVGLALVIFFLLLLALSEHMVFWAAYLIASTACVGLVGIYSIAALGSASNGAGVTTALGALYGMLYAILKSEDNALLMGSLLLFLALAAVMLVTRRVDWYELGQHFKSPKAAVEPPASK